MTYNIIVGGSGGQGVMSLVDLLAECAIVQEYNVKVMKYKGLAQRGGSVRAFLRIGDVESPIFPRYSADLVVSLELAETLNLLEYIGHETKVLIADYRIPSVLNAIGIERYPEDLLDMFSKSGYYILPAERDLKENKLPVITLNTYMLGAISVILSGIFPKNLILRILKKRLKRFVDENILSFELGMKRAIHLLKAP
ncbi:MAG: 2-oxoacid:acceptor oxidoreductase family protein [Euryarchaeota archaeon]|nr:2-oxoacid:acceptor oxidoreductase family protein [Euryarchaeota archaeon]